MRLDLQRVSGGTVLAGALHGRKVLSDLLAETAAEPLWPEPVFLDFGRVKVATASFLRESILAFRDHIRGRHSSFYPVIANANNDLRDELIELARSRGDALMVCTLANEDQVEDVSLLGELNPKQKTTFELVQQRGETDAGELKREYGEREGVTAWNNRLSALAALGLIVEISQGRNKRYRPLFSGA